MVGRVRATRSKAQAVTDDSMGLDVNPQVKKKRGGQVAKDVQNVEPSDELNLLCQKLRRRLRMNLRWRIHLLLRKSRQNEIC